MSPRGWRDSQAEDFVTATGFQRGLTAQAAG